MNDNEQFSRTISLIGQEAFDNISEACIAVFGIGGVGGYVVEALARSGIKNIAIIDNDKVAFSNINRQIIATHKTVGKLKVDVMEDRLLDINPNINIKKYNFFVSPETISQFDFENYDYIVDAIDTVSGKIALVEKAKEYSIPIISSMGAGNKMNPEMFEVADIYKTSVCPLARVMRQELKKRKIKKLKVVYSKEQPYKQQNQNKRIPSSIAFTPSVAGFIISAEVIKDLILVKK